MTEDTSVRKPRSGFYACPVTLLYCMSPARPVWDVAARTVAAPERVCASPSLLHSSTPFVGLAQRCLGAFRWHGRHSEFTLRRLGRLF